MGIRSESPTGAMQPKGYLFPDVTSQIVLALRADLPTTTYVAIDLAKWDRASTSVQVIRIGGVSSAMFDMPVLQVDVRSVYWDDAVDTMGLVRQSMGGFPLRLQQVKYVRETSGVRYLPDVDEDRARVTCDFTVTVAANP